MPDSKLSDRSAVNTVLDTDEYLVARSGTTRKITGADLKAQVNAEASGATQAELDAHVSDPAAAHAASAISILDAAGDFTATEIEGALAELQAADEADEAALATHLADPTDAHDASAVSFVPTGMIAATDVQSAIAEVAAESVGGTTPIGPAGGALDGAYPDPILAVNSVGAVNIEAAAVGAAEIADGVITDAKIAAANKDGAAGTASLRTLGAGATQALKGTTRLDELADPTGDVDLNNQKITGLGTPTNATDAVTKGYADALTAGLGIKASVDAATTANITLSGTQTIDGVSVGVGDRVLVKNQSAGAANGIYVAAAGAWARATDADTSGEVTAGMFTFVEAGTANGDQGWVLATNDPITLDTTALVFTQFSGAGGGGGSPTGAAGGVLAGTYPNPSLAAGVLTRDVVFAGVGAVAVATGNNRYRVSAAYTITGVTAVVDSAPSGAALLVDVNKNGTTIFTTQGNRPSIAASAFDSGVEVPDVTTLADGDILTVDVDQVGSINAGSDLTVQVIIQSL